MPFRLIIHSYMNQTPGMKYMHMASEIYGDAERHRGDADGKDRGRIVCGDVGQSSFEELDLLTKGANYGWNSREGFECFDRETCGKIGPEMLPIHAYNHRVGKSVTGGHFYRGCESPNLDGLYIYGDYVRGRLFGLSNKDGVWENKELFMCGPDICLNLLQSTYEMNILSFGEDEQGEVYMLSTGNASPHARAGKVYKIVDPARRGNPELCSSVRRQSSTDQTTDLGYTNVNTTSSDFETGTTVSTGMVSSSFGKVNMLIITCILLPRSTCVVYEI